MKQYCFFLPKLYMNLCLVKMNYKHPIFIAYSYFLSMVLNGTLFSLRNSPNKSRCQSVLCLITDKIVVILRMQMFESLFKVVILVILLYLMRYSPLAIVHWSTFSIGSEPI